MADPVAVLEEILDFCGGGADRDVRMERIRAEIRGLVKSDNTEKWRKQVPADAIRVIERVAGPLLEELGYPVLNPDVSGRKVGTAELAWLHADRLVRNLVHTNPGVMLRYRLEVLKAHRRARARA